MTGINREPLLYWPSHQQDHYTDLLGRQTLESFAEFQRELNQNLYGDDKPYVPPSRWKRVRNWLADNRITNAWLVLIGREDIDREYR